MKVRKWIEIAAKESGVDNTKIRGVTSVKRCKYIDKSIEKWVSLGIIK